MKTTLKLFVFTILLLLFNQVLYGKTCYLFITNPATFKYETVFEIGSALLNNFVEEVRQVPRSGIGKNDCVYNMTVLSNQGTITVSINGPEINSIGESTSSGLIGLQKAILLAIFRSDEEVRKEMCASYISLIPKECEQVKKSEPSFEGVWRIYYKEDNEEIIAFINEDNQVFLCELKNKKVEDVSDGYINNNQFYWGDDEGISIELKNNNTLIMHNEDPDEFERLEKMPEKCLKRFKEEK